MEDDKLKDYLAKQGLPTPSSLTKLPAPQAFTSSEAILDQALELAGAVIGDLAAKRAAGRPLTKEDLLALKDAAGIVADIRKDERDTEKAGKLSEVDPAELDAFLEQYLARNPDKAEKLAKALQRTR